jgi:hypothetical protein
VEQLLAEAEATEKCVQHVFGACATAEPIELVQGLPESVGRKEDIVGLDKA